MDVVDEVVEQGVAERRFDLEVEGEVVPGILWAPAEEAGPAPVVLVGHGGTQHKRVANVLSLARRLVRHLGYRVVALDAPDHGERVDPTAAEEARRRLGATIERGRAGAGPKGLELDEAQARAWLERTRRGVAEWKALLDALEDADGLTDGRFGYWGVSMGTAIGLPFVADEPRIGAAVLGLAGLSSRPGADDFEAAARRLRAPVLFLFQWDDELMTRESGTALFDALGSEEKTMHVNPGGHVEIPLHERDAAEAFYVRHLGAAG